PLLALALASGDAPGRPAGGSGADADTVAEVLRRRLAEPGAAGLLSPELVSRFYARRAYAPAWSRDAGIYPHAEALARAVREAEAEGLRPRDYRPERIEKSLERLREGRGGEPLDPGERAALDLLLSDAFLTLAGHLAQGRIDPKRIHSGWSLPPREVDVVAALERAVRDGRVEAVLG